MTMSYAQQNRFGATAGDACSAMPMFAFVLILLGTALAVSFFVSLNSLILVLPVLVLAVLLITIIMVRRVAARPRNRQG